MQQTRNKKVRLFCIDRAEGGRKRRHRARCSTYQRRSKQPPAHRTERFAGRSQEISKGSFGPGRRGLLESCLPPDRPPLSGASASTAAPRPDSRFVRGGGFAPQTAQTRLHLRLVVVFILAPLPPGGRGRVGIAISFADRWFWAGSGPDPGGYALFIFILALTAAGQRRIRVHWPV